MIVFILNYVKIKSILIAPKTNKGVIMQIKIEKLDLKSSYKKILELAEVYKKVFAEDSKWQEALICPRCEAAFAQTNKSPFCTDCYKFHQMQVPLVEFWPTKEILQRFYKAMDNELGSVCYIAVEQKNQTIIGFCWGFVKKALKLIDENLEIKPEDQNDFLSTLKNQFHIFPTDPIVYQNEIAILPDYQKQGFGLKLFIARHSYFVDQGLKDKLAVFKTLQNPPSSTYLWLVEKLGYQILYQHQKNRKTVVAGLPIKTALNYYKNYLTP